MTISADLLELVSDHDEVVRRMGELKPSRRVQLLGQLEHVQRVERGLPVFWFAPAGSKAKGGSEHWVFVAPGEPLFCTCDEILYPGPQPEGPTLEAIVAHFKAVA